MTACSPKRRRKKLDAGIAECLEQAHSAAKKTACALPADHFYEGWEQISGDYSFAPEGLRMLTDRRIDILVYNTPAALLFMESAKGQAILNVTGNPKIVYNAGLMGAALGHAWLHKSHAALANPLAAVLRQMKAEGLFESYSRQTGFHPDKRSPKWVNGPKQKP